LAVIWNYITMHGHMNIKVDKWRFKECKRLLSSRDISSFLVQTYCLKRRRDRVYCYLFFARYKVQ